MLRPPRPTLHFNDRAGRPNACTIRRNGFYATTSKIPIKPVTAKLVETVLSRQLVDLEPTLARHGYRFKDMTEQFDAKAAEIRERRPMAGLPI